ECLRKMIEGFKNGDSQLIKQQITANRLLLQQLSLLSGVSIETPALTSLCDIAEQFGGAAKSSGAGGGDCGIVITEENDNTEKIINEWQKEDIQPLDLD
ncbi:phosphomevalonate kinase, partial [Pediococcus acidilactici]